MKSLFIGFCLLLITFTAAAQNTKSIIIVTTDKIRTSSAKLDDFITEKKKRGFTVKLVTEHDYHAQDQKGQTRAIAIRNWLAEHKDQATFLLLIGNAHPKYGDVPMFTVWPRHSYSTSECGGFAVDCRSFESDTPYSSLSGNWDLNGNGQWGEHTLDDGPGGISFTPDLIVGRIPVYMDDTAELDEVLDHAISYMQTPEQETGYRKKMLFPAAFYYFKGQEMTTFTIEEDFDGADNAEWFINNIITKHPTFSPTRLYETEGTVVAPYLTDLALTKENLITEWQKGYGMVYWFGHSNEKELVRTIWNDQNLDSKPQNNEFSNPRLLSASDAGTIGAKGPAFVLAASCEVGSAQVPGNLSYELLRSGTAAGMIGSSNITPSDETDYTKNDSVLDTINFGVTNFGVLFFDQIMEGEYPAKALANLRNELGTASSIENYAGKMMLNYFGDPTLRITDNASEALEQNDEKINDSLPVLNADRDIVTEPDKSSGGCSLVLF